MGYTHKYEKCVYTVTYGRLGNVSEYTAFPLSTTVRIYNSIGDVVCQFLCAGKWKIGNTTRMNMGKLIRIALQKGMLCGN